MKWLVLGKGYHRERYEVLSEYMSSIGLKNELSLLEVDGDQLLDLLEEAKGKFDQVRIERPFCEEVAKVLPHLSTQVKTIGAADAFSQTEGSWWPRNYLSTSITRIFANKFDNLDLTKAGFVVGTGAMARASAAALVQLGYQRVNVTDRFTEKAQNFVKEMKKSFFGVNLEFTSLDNLTNLPGHHQVVINTTPLVKENKLLQELYYFNYMENQGIVVDMTLVPPQTPLIREARTVQASTVEGVEVAAWTDRIWCEQVFDINFSHIDYCNMLRKKLEEIDFDLSPFVVMPS